MKNRHVVIVLALVSFCVLLLGGCGSESGNEAGSAASPGEVVQDFYHSLFGEDYAAAYDMLSSLAREKISYEQFESGMRQSLQAAPIDMSMQVEIVSEVTDGDTATVTASFLDSEGEINMVREDGAWKISE